MAASKVVKTNSKKIKSKRKARAVADGTSTPSAAATPERGAKTKFILGYPMDTPSREIVDAGAAKGLVFSQTYVASIRNSARRKAGVPATRGPRAGKAPAAVAAPKAAGKAPRAGGNSAEDRLVALVLELGVGKARDVVNFVERSLAGLKYPG